VLRHALANISTAGPAPYSNKWLVGFDRPLSITPGSSATMTIPVPIGAVGRVDTFGNGVLYPGQYELALNNERSAVMSFTLTGNATMLAKWPADPSWRCFVSVRRRGTKPPGSMTVAIPRASSL